MATKQPEVKVKEATEIRTQSVATVEDDQFSSKSPNQPNSQALNSFVNDDLKRTIRPIGHDQPGALTYGFQIWQGAVQTLTATTAISPIAGIIPVVGSGAVIITANPSITIGVAGQTLVLKGTSNTNTVTLKDGLGMRLVGSITLGLYDTLTLYYDGDNLVWVETARTNWISSTTSVSTSSMSTSSSSSSSSSTTTP